MKRGKAAAAIGGGLALGVGIALFMVGICTLNPAVGIAGAKLTMIGFALVGMADS